MSLTTTIASKTYLGNDVATAFDSVFVIWEAADVEVWITDESTGLDTEIAASAFSVVPAGAYPSNVTVNYPLSGDPVASGDKITLRRTVVFKQDWLALVNNTDFLAEELENAIDKLVSYIQQNSALIDRAILVGVSELGDYENYLLLTQEAAAAAEAAAATVLLSHDEFTATPGQTAFNLSFLVDVDERNAVVHVDGLLTPDSDVTFTDTSTITLAAMTGGEIVIIQSAAMTGAPSSIGAASVVDATQATTVQATIDAHEVSLNALGTAAVLDVDEDVLLAADSNSLIATQKATKAYVDMAVATSTSVVAQDATASASSGTGAQDLKTYTVAAGTLGVNDQVHVKAWGTIAGTNDAKSVIIQWEASGGGTSKDLAVVSAAAGDVGDFVVEGIAYNRGAANSQYLSGSGIHDSVETLVDDSTNTVDTAATGMVLNIVGDPDNAGDTITVNAWTVTIVPAP